MLYYSFIYLCLSSDLFILKNLSLNIGEIEWKFRLNEYQKIEYKIPSRMQFFLV